jgi:hypothetical protein
MVQKKVVLHFHLIMQRPNTLPIHFDFRAIPVQRIHKPFNSFAFSLFSLIFFLAAMKLLFGFCRFDVFILLFTYLFLVFNMPGVDFYFS